MAGVNGGTRAIDRRFPMLLSVSSSLKVGAVAGGNTTVVKFGAVKRGNGLTGGGE